MKIQIENWLSGSKRHFLSIDDPAYPLVLKEIHGSPPYLYVEGNLNAFLPTAVGVVGSRNASVLGKQNAQLFSREIASNRLAIASGLALGVDGAAHRGALDVDGVTLAVLATGLDVVYPKKHTKLAEEIKERGAIISEMSLGTLPIPANFPRRNRVISGLSAGVLVVEASLKSGSLITAQYAIEQNREVFAIPGTISNPMTQGCHQLIKQGATLVESASDVLEGLSFIARPSIGQAELDLSELSADEKKILTAMGHGQAIFDELVASTQFPIHDLMQHLMELELKGLVASIPGGYQRI